MYSILSSFYSVLLASLAMVSSVVVTATWTDGQMKICLAKIEVVIFIVQG